MLKMSSELLNSYDQELALNDLVEIRKQSALEEAEEPEPVPKVRTMTVTKLTEGLGVTETGIKALEDIYTTISMNMYFFLNKINFFATTASIFALCL
jgi:hypothetical protein